MLMQVPGKTRWAIILGGVLSLILLTLAVGPPSSGAKGPAQAAPSPSPKAEILFTGKFFCSLKRQVVMPFKGVITSVKVKPGQRVAPGEVLARYRLAEEAVLQVRQRLFPYQVKELEMRLVEIEKNLESLKSKQREQTQLAQHKLAAAESKTQIDREVGLLTKERLTVQERLGQARLVTQDDLALLKKQLGNGVQSGQIPQEAALVAPIRGHIIWVQPNLQENAEMEAGTVMFQVGVMDPMLVRAQAYEIEALELTQGDVAEVSLESQPERKFQGVLRRLSWAPLASGLEQPSYYEMELDVPNPDLFLKEGLKARIVFRKSR